MNSGVFTASELGYIGRVYGVLSDRRTQCLDRLEMVMTADELRMSDAGRMQAIDQVDADVSDQLEGLRRFNDELTVQALQRAREINSINILKNMYGIHP
jgi:enoyl-CoA hydratase/carnithine racemase